jgi:GT2 family glycosyltransferase
LDLSIIIINWNTIELLARALRSVYEAGDDLASEVLVVDNASSDGSAAMVRQRFPQACLIENAQNAGFAAANNQAIRQSQGRHVLLLNSDAQVCPGALQALVAFMEGHPRAGACGPRLLNADGTLQPSCHPMLTPGREFWRLLFLERLWPRATYPQRGWDRHRPRQVEVIKGACLLLRRAALKQVGLLDERYFMYSEEMDLCYRLLRAGWELWWVPSAAVGHHGQASTDQAAEDMYLQLYRSKVQFYRKFGADRRARAFKALLALAYLPRWAVAATAGPFSGPKMQARARTYRRLLARLPEL